MRIEALDWSNLDWMPDKTRLSVRYFGQRNEAYRCVDVMTADVLAVWPAPGTQEPDIVIAPAVAAGPKREGRPAGTSQGGRVMADHLGMTCGPRSAASCTRKEIRPTDPARYRLIFQADTTIVAVDRDLDAPSNQTLEPHSGQAKNDNRRSPRLAPRSSIRFPFGFRFR